MRENLPKELNFVHEASNAEHLASDFSNLRTSLYIPKVLFASKRVSKSHVVIVTMLNVVSLFFSF